MKLPQQPWLVVLAAVVLVLQHHVSAFSLLPPTLSSTATSTTNRLLLGTTILSASSSDDGKVDDYDAWVEQLDPSIFEDTDSTRVAEVASRGGMSVDGGDSSTTSRDNDGSSRGGGGYNNDRGGYNDRGGGRDNDRRGGGSSRGGSSSRGGGSTLRHDYERDYDADSSRVDEAAVNSMIGERLQARKTGQFEVADRIRDDLLQQHGVTIWDKDRLWRSGCSSSGSGSRWGRGGDGGGHRPNDNRRGGGGGDRFNDNRRGGGGRDRFNNDRGGGRSNDRRGGDRGGRRPQQNFGPNGHDYSLSGDAGAHTSRLAEGEVHDMLAERLQCKLARNFRVADEIQNELFQNGVFVHDGRKEWRADGVGFGDSGGGDARGYGKPTTQRGSRVDLNGPYQMSEYSESLTPADSEDDDAATTAAEEVKSRIQELVDERLEARMDRDYNVADAVREDLKRDYNVEIDDRKREWSVGGAFDKPPGPFEMSQYSQSLESLTSNDGEGVIDVEASQELRKRIEQMIEERDQAKAIRDYNVADAIREDLRDEFNIEVRDREREWSIGGFFEPPPEPYKMSTHSQEPTTISSQEVTDMVQERDDARAARAYDAADDIKFGLLEDHNIVIDDKLKQWSVDGEFGEEQASRSRFEGSSQGFARRGGGNLSDEQLATIEQLLDERMEYKRDREFGKADRIRDSLMDDYQIRVDDRSMEWHVVTTEYAQAPSPHSLDQDALDYIQKQITERAVAKHEKNFEVADNIRHALMDQFAVSIDDRLKEWTVVIDVQSRNSDGSALDSGAATLELESADDSSEVDEVESQILEAVQEDNEEKEEEDEGEEADEGVPLEGLTVVELKERLRSKGLPVSGRKADLVERLQQ